METAKQQYKCRFCHHSLNQVFLDLGSTPLANSYLTKEQLNDHESYYPLCVYICENCLLVQLPSLIKPEEIFKDYAYFSSYSSSWLEHAKEYSEMIIKKLNLNGHKFAVEIASNDGYLLKNFVNNKIPCLGIEPAENIAKVAIEHNIPTEICFFGEDNALQISNKYSKADLIIANNVLAHVPDLNNFICGFKILLKPTGTITIEFPHILNLISHSEFDTIYHEHYSYFSIYSLDIIFKSHGLRIYDIENLTTHGGSLRIYVCHLDDKSKPSSTSNMSKIHRQEQLAKLDSLQGYIGIANKAKIISQDLMHFLLEAKSSHKIVAAYGAAAKGNTLLNFTKVTPDLIQCVYDKNPHKQNHYLPGSHLPVYSPNLIKEHKPDYLLILPWNLKEEIYHEWQVITTWGGKFVTAIPKLYIWS